MYDSWKSIMELYMQKKEHGRMILESVEHGPLIWPTIEENGVTRTKRYEELSVTKKILADCDLKATNIILQGLPTDVYSLQFQVNTKFLNNLPPEWSKFVTDVKLVRDLHTSNFYQLYAYIEQHKLHANEVRIMRERIQDPLALSPQYGSIHPTQHYSTTYPSTPHAITYSSTSHPNAYSSTVHQDAYRLRLAVPVFKKGDDPIDAINKMMSLLSTVVSSRRQSSFAAGTSGTRVNISGIGGNNSGQQRVVKYFNFQREAQGSGKVLNEEELEFLADFGVAEVLMANLSSYGSDVLSKVPHSDNTHNDMLNQSVQEMSYSEQTHLVNYPENEITSDSNNISYSQYLLKTQNAVVQDINSSAQQDAMILSVFEQLSNQVTNCNKVNKDNLIANESLSAELERYKEREKESLTKTFNAFKNESKEKEAKNIDNEIALENKVKELDNIVHKMGESAQTVHMLTKQQVFYDNNLKQALDFQNPFYLKKAQQIRPMLYNGSVIAKEINVILIADSEDTLMLEEESRSKMLLKQNFGKHFVPQQELSDDQAFWLQPSHPNTNQSASSPIMPDALTEGEWGFEHTKAVFLKEIIPFVKTLKDIFNVFDKDLLNEATEVQTVFNQMEVVVQQYHVDKQCFEIQKKQFLIENDRLLNQIISQDIVNIVVNSSLDINTSVKVNSFVAIINSVNYVEMCNKCLELEAELIKQHNMIEKDEYNKLSKRFFEHEQHCISLEIAMQLNKEIFQKNNTSVNQTEPPFDQLFELNNLKAKLQAKDTTIEKLKANIKRLNKFHHKHC
ncbi:hypothetical protein Tco_0739899 [Tanacetum coccineum]